MRRAPYRPACCLLVLPLVLAACHREPESIATDDTTPPPPTAASSAPVPTTAFTWPASVAAFGDGFPDPGAPCRRLGEAAATANYLDDSADLVGCPGSASDAAAMALVHGRGARVVGTIDGVTLLSVPMRSAMSGAGAGTPAAPMPESADATVPGTPFHATAMVPCAATAGAALVDCQAGAIRRTDGSADVHVTLPGGGKRILYFGPEGVLKGSDAAGTTARNTRDGDVNTITVAGERYVIADALPYGG